jgi:hypothetical protein
LAPFQNNGKNQQKLHPRASAVLIKTSAIVSMRLPCRRINPTLNKQTQPHQRACVCAFFLLLPGETPIKPVRVLFKINANKRQPLSAERNKFELSRANTKIHFHLFVLSVPFFKIKEYQRDAKERAAGGDVVATKRALGKYKTGHNARARCGAGNTQMQ